MYMPAQMQLKPVKMVEIEPESDVPADVVSDYDVGLAADGVSLHVGRDWPEA